MGSEPFLIFNVDPHGGADTKNISVDTGVYVKATGNVYNSSTFPICAGRAQPPIANCCAAFEIGVVIRFCTIGYGIGRRFALFRIIVAEAVACFTLAAEVIVCFTDAE